MKPEELQKVKLNFNIIGNSIKLNAAIGAAARVSDTDISVLIHGENGSGKESFSKIIHHLSKRKHKNFFAINCGGIPSGTINSELFGHEKGAFTGATGDRKGYFEEANGGTLFLDEIGDMPLDTQAMLLRVLEYGEYIRVGSSEVRKTNVRIIAATNVNLSDAVANKKFREDLYYRLNSYSITVPALRERGEDILLLFRKFARDYGDQYSARAVELTDEAAKLLLTYHFPGNVRELRNIVNQLNIDSEDNRTITAAFLQPYLRGASGRNLPMLSSYSNTALGYNNTEAGGDRDMLWKVMFDLKRDMHELKSLVGTIMNGGVQVAHNTEYASTAVGHTNDFLPYNMNGHDLKVSAIPNPSSTKEETTIIPTNYSVQNLKEEKDVVDIEHEDDLESLSLTQNEREMIWKALRKHNNRRAAAAQELGISERTLYRKIKQYNINL
jgi:transcriptional regulator with PAS, ATPase and Fis domain